MPAPLLFFFSFFFSWFWELTQSFAQSKEVLCPPPPSTHWEPYPCIASALYKDGQYSSIPPVMLAPLLQCSGVLDSTRVLVVHGHGRAAHLLPYVSSWVFRISPCERESRWFLFAYVHHCMGGSGMTEPLDICPVDGHQPDLKLSLCHSLVLL